MTTPKQHGFSAIFGGSAFVFSCRVFGAAMTLILQVLLARWIGADALGVYVLAFSWCVLLATASQLGLVNATVRVIGQAHAEGRPGVIWGFILRAQRIIVGAALLAALCGCAIIWRLDDSLPGGASAPFLLAMVVTPLLSLISFQCMIAVAFRWLKTAFLATEVVRPIALVVGVSAVWLWFGSLVPSTVMIVQIVVLTATAAVLGGLIPMRLRGEIAVAEPVYETRTWLNVALPLLLITFFGNYFPELMLIVLGPLVSSDQISIFNASYRLALIVTFGLTAIDSVTSPTAARLYAAHRIDELQVVVSRATQLGVLGSVSALAGFALLGEWLLSLFGSEFVVGHRTMMILVSAQVVRSAAGPVMSLLAVTGHQRRCLVVFATALVASVGISVALVPTFGIEGAAIAVVLVTLGWSIWLHALVVRHVGIRPSILGAFIRPRRREAAP